MTRAVAIVVLAILLLPACTSPEAERTRGGGPGADTGNRGQPIVMHAGSQPFHETPRLAAAKAPPIDASTQARDLSRR